jgi:hypothetical protein
MDFIIQAAVIFFLLFLIFALLSIVYWSWRNGISPMPSSRKAKRCLLGALSMDIRGPIFELGSGWGTLAFPLARKFPECHVKAYENSLIPFLFSKCRHHLDPLPNLKFYHGDFFKVPLGEARLVVCYLYPEAMRRLKTKFQQELLPGAWLISNTFSIAGWKPKRIYEVGDLYRTKIFLYQKSENESTKTSSVII